jgi:hypothetical protein
MEPNDMEEKFLELKHRLSENKELDYFFRDKMIKRFLVGRKGNVEHAYRALLRCAVFRKENNADNLTIEDAPHYAAARVAVVTSKDKSNRPVCTCIAGRHRSTICDIDEFRRYMIYTLDEAVRQNPDDETITVLFDLSAFSMACMDYHSIQVFIDILGRMYPEILGLGLVVNAPWIFWACWAIIKIWIDPVTVEKIRFISLAELPQYIEEDKISPDVGVRSFTLNY